VGRLVNYKRVDLAIRSCQQLGLNLVIVGHGPDRKRLQKIASNNTSADTRLIGSQPQTVVNFLMQKAKAVLSLGVEDFGLVPLQANLLGTPAVINSQSGVAEVIQQEGSVKVTDLSTKTITSALSAIQKKNWDKTAMKINAQKFTCNRFLFQFKNVITSLVSKKI
jgi:glycosyltransferase involved in cell wall biosynthesis